MSTIQDERGFNQIYTAYAATIRKERRCDYIIGKMNLSEKSSVLEIGCGTGEGLFYISKKTGFKCLGIDLSEKFIDYANKNYINKDLKFAVVDFNKTETFTNDVAYDTFDYIIGNGILHHLYYNIDNSLANIYKLLKPGGKIIFIEPNVYNPYVALIFNIPFLRKKASLEPDEMAFSRPFIKEKLKKNGYVNCDVEIRDFLLPIIPSVLIKPSIIIGNLVEKTPLTLIAQSLFIIAEKKG